MTYETPRLTLVASDPKIHMLTRAIRRLTLRSGGRLANIGNPEDPRVKRHAALWTARNRRTRVLMFKARDA